MENGKKQQVTAIVALYLSAALISTQFVIVYSAECYRLLLVCPNQHWVGSKHIFNPILHINVSKSQQVDLELSVPQDSICGPVLYTVNASTLQHFIKKTPGSHFLVMPKTILNMIVLMQKY